MERRKNHQTREAVEDALQKRDIKDLHDDIKAILTQTRLTNGRVTKLEGWKSFMTGGMAILTIVVVPLTFLVIKLVLEI